MEIYGVKIVDQKKLMQSTSGGAFNAFATEILHRNGVVFGATYDYGDNTVKYISVKEENELQSILGSKYLQSNMLPVLDEFDKLLKLLETECLIGGTPCQIAAIIKYCKIKKINLEKVYFVDLICHGVPSPGFWKKYVKHISDGENISSVKFRDKTDGWLNPKAFIVAKNVSYSIESYMRLFYEKLLMRESCYNCKYCTFDRKSDITIGDYWNVKKYNPDFYNKFGVSSLIVHTQKGRDLLEKSKKRLDIIESCKTAVEQPNLKKSTKKPSYYEMFWKDEKQLCFDELLKKYTSMGFNDRLKRKVSIMLNKFIPVKNNEKTKEEFNCVCETNKCCGCAICVHACPHEAIAWTQSKKGFFYPNIDESKCVKCDLCKKYCVMYGVE